MISSFLSGVNAFVHGVKLLSNKKLRHFVIIPLILNIVVYTLLIWFAAHYFHHLTAWVMAQLPHWLAWLTWLLWILFFLAIYLTLVYSFTFLANLIASPFSGYLCENTLHILKHQPTFEGNWADVIKDIPKSISRELLKLGYYLPRAIGFLLLFLIPGVNVVASVLWLLFNGWMMAIQYVDFPADNHRENFSNVKQFCRQNRLAALGFGLSAMVASLIPIVNFFALPAAICGATSLWASKQNKPTKPQSDVPTH